MTKTSIGIDVDATPPAASIAYDRVDGYIGPTYENGAVPPVVSSIRSDLAVFTPQVKQVYATGNAAWNVVSITPRQVQPLPLTGERKVMFFGTSTTAGLKVDFAETGVPNSVSLGYKRKEVSVIPIIGAAGQDGKKVDHYPSVLATLDMRTSAASLDGTSLGMAQFFATGDAAEILASDPEVQHHLRQPARELTKSLMQVAAVSPEVQLERESVAGYVKSSLDAGQLNQLAASLGVTQGDEAMSNILLSLASATTMDQVRAHKQKIKILFGKDL